MRDNKIRLPFKLKKPILAFGSQNKNTICFAKDVSAYISCIHQDLSLPKERLIFEKDARRFLKRHPAILACDLHPEYVSTQFASSVNLKKTFVQHHYAHIAACMAENMLNSKVIGVAFDGTGLGTDNSIWGGEFLVCDYKNCLRIAHLKTIPLVGGEKAVLEPWRLVAAWFNFCHADRKTQMLKEIYKAKINSPMASSMGRLFDAAAAVILKKNNAGFEAELAIALEKSAESAQVKKGGYSFDINYTKGAYILNPLPILRQASRDLKKSVPRQEVAWRFHVSVARMIAKTCLILRKDYKINRVVLSGGVFQNKILTNLALDLLYRHDFKVYIHKYLSCNDSCISLGQAVIAGHKE